MAPQRCLFGECGGVCLRLFDPEFLCCGEVLCHFLLCSNGKCCTRPCGQDCLDDTNEFCCNDEVRCSWPNVCSGSNICTTRAIFQPSSTRYITPTTTARTVPTSRRPTTTLLQFTTSSKLSAKSRTPYFSSSTTLTPSTQPLSSFISATLSSTTSTSRVTGDPTSSIITVSPTVPESVKNDPAAACFLQSSFTPFYTTPAWYTSLPTPAQASWLSSHTSPLNNVVCSATQTINPTLITSSTKAGLSTGAKAGIGAGVGVTVSVAILLGILAILKFKPALLGMGKVADQGDSVSPGDTSRPEMTSTVASGPETTSPGVFQPVDHGHAEVYPVLVATGVRRQQEKAREIYVRTDTNFSSVSGSSAQHRIARKPVPPVHEPVSPITDSESGGEMVDLSSLGGHWDEEAGGRERYEPDGKQRFEGGRN